jgi:hypothetical protein
LAQKCNARRDKQPLVYRLLKTRHASDIEYLSPGFGIVLPSSPSRRWCNVLPYICWLRCVSGIAFFNSLGLVSGGLRKQAATF